MVERCNIENCDIRFLAYAAGFFDADGTVGVYLHPSKSSVRGGTYELSVRITQKLWMPIFVKWQDRWGGVLVPSDSGKRRPWCWVLCSRKAALPFLEDVSPYVWKKKDQVDLAIEFQKRMVQRGGIGLSDAEFAWQESVAKALKEMKRVANPAPEDLLAQIRRTAAELSGQLELWPEDR